MNSNSKIVWLYGTFEEVRAFKNAVPDPHGGLGIKLKAALRGAGYEVKITHDGKNLGVFDALIFQGMDRASYEAAGSYPRERCFLIATEPPVVRPEYYHPMFKNRIGKIFTLLDRYVDNETYFKIYHPIIQHNRVSQEEVVPFEEKKLSCMILGGKHFGVNPSELYTERRNTARKFTQFGEFDLYGNLWDGFSSWKGMAPLNKTILKNYRFAICYENCWDQPGFVTERIFNSLLSRNIPVYLGAPNITDYVPKECFIDVRNFCKSGRISIDHRRLWQHMKSMDRSTYEKYIEAGQNYIDNNPKIKLFTIQNIVDKVMDSF